MKKLINFAICITALMLLASCTEKTIEVSVVDGRTTTVVEVQEGETVEDILAEAEIDLNDKDIVTPSADTPISDAGAVIILTRNCNVEIICDNEPFAELCLSGTVADAIENAGITPGEHDVVNHDMGMYLTDGLVIEYIHRLAVYLDVDGEKKEIITSAKNVSELLDENNIRLGSEDRLNKDKDAVLAENDVIVVERVDVQTITENEDVAFETKTEYTDSLYQGQSSIKQEGVNGKKTVTYEVTYVDGIEESRRQVDEKTVKEPIDEIVVQGTKKKPSEGKTVVSREQVYDCNGSGHGYWIITYSDGTVEYVDF